ncbi:MAG: DUF3566 domain-containing protein [Pseudonocardiaceae bacterium]
MTRPENPGPAEMNGEPAPDADAELPTDVVDGGEPAVSAEEQSEPDIAEPEDTHGEAAQPAPQDPRYNGSTNGAATAAPPWQRAGTSPTDWVPAPATQADGSSAGEASPTGASRYGHPVAQPISSQPSWTASQEFSRPTVRIGGRVQSEQPSSQPPTPPRVRSARIPRRASLQLRYLEPWSVLKVSLVLSVAGFVAWMIAVGVLYSVLAGMGVWDQLNGTYSDLTSVSNPQVGQELISAGGVFGVAALIGLVNIVLITATCTVGAFIYNASSDLVGGIEVTLAERD